MENLKVRVNNEAESKEAQGYFEDLGAVCCSGLERSKNVNFLFMNSGFVTACKLQENFDKSKCKEITLPELRDLVVLKRNDVGDATHESPCGELKFILLGDWWNLFTGWKWQQFSHKQSPRCNKLKPIEKPMKEPKQAEFLVKTDSGYVLQVLDENAGGEDVVRVPDGAHSFRENLKFYNKDGSKFYHSNNYWDDSRSEFKILWKRETLNDQVASAEEFKQPEDLPFLDNGVDIGVENLPEFKPFNNGPVEHDSTAFTNLGIEYPIKKEIKTDFPLNNYELNHRVAKAFNAVRGTDLNEDDVNYIRELINLTISHYTDRF